MSLLTFILSLLKVPFHNVLENNIKFLFTECKEYSKLVTRIRNKRHIAGGSKALPQEFSHMVSEY